jgi:hypothetical protein
VGFGVDFAPQDFFCTRHRQRRDLQPQRFAGARYFLLDFRLGSRFLAVAFVARCILRFFNHLRNAFFGLGDDFGGARPRFGDFFIRLYCGPRERLPAFLAGGETVRNLLLARGNGIGQRRPYELRAKKMNTKNVTACATIVTFRFMACPC